MFISTADVREGRQGGGREASLGEEEEEESQQRTVSRRVAESWQTENVFSHVTADYIHSRVGKEQEETDVWMNDGSFHVVPQRTLFSETILLLIDDLHYFAHFGAPLAEW